MLSASARSRECSAFSSAGRRTQTLAVTGKQPPNLFADVVCNKQGTMFDVGVFRARRRCRATLTSSAGWQGGPAQTSVIVQEQKCGGVWELRASSSIASMMLELACEQMG